MSDKTCKILADRYLDGTEAVTRLIDGDILLTETGRRVYFYDNYFFSDGTIFERQHRPSVFNGPFNNFVDMRYADFRDKASAGQRGER